MTKFEPSAKAILARNLKNLMAKSRYNNRKKLSDASGVSEGTIGYMKAGTGNPTLENIGDVARVFGLEAWEMLIDHDVTRKRILEKILTMPASEISNTS